MGAETTPIRSREAGENFPVALRVLPRTYRDDLHAVYAFARMVDEVGDSFAGDRLARLAELDADVERIWDADVPVEPVLRGLVDTVQRTDMPPEPFHRLISANICDQTRSCYATFDDLRAYCRLSAEPIGRIVLHIFDQAEGEYVRARSDDVCTALQLLEHWQDVAEDRRAGRIYLPREDLAAHGVPESDLDAAVATDRLRALMRFEIERAATLLERGSVLVSMLHGWGRLSVAGYVAGGRATVDALRRTDGDVLGRDSSPSTFATASHLIRLLTWPRTRTRP